MIQTFAQTVPHFAFGEKEAVRERGLLPSRSGRRFTLLEIHRRRVGPGDEEWNWQTEAFELSGWLGPHEAERRLTELEASERWLTASCQERMRQGALLAVEELEWMPSSA